MQYFLDGKNKLLSTLDCSKDIRGAKLISSKIFESDEIIVGRKCQHIVEEFDDGEIHSFYYDTTLYFNPIHFQNHKLTHLDETMKKMKSQFLGYVYKTNANYTLVYRATNVVETTLDDSIFEIK